MDILDRYIGKTIAMGVLAVLFVMLTLDSLISFAGETEDIGRANYDVWQAIKFVLLNIPQKLYRLFPMIALLGTMMSLGMLASNSELIAIRAAGVSVLRITLSVLKTGVILAALVIVIGEFIAPPAIQYAKLERVAAMERKISLNTDYGLWARDTNNYIHIRRVENDGRLIGVNLYIFDDSQNLIETINAASASYMEIQEQWQLYRVTRNKISPNAIEKSVLPTMQWKSLLNPEVVSVVSVTPENLSIWKLRGYIEYLKDNQLDSREYELSFWSKVIAPVTIAVMIVLAVPFVFGSLRNVGAGQRIVVGFLLGLGFYIFNQLIAKAGLVYELPPILSAMVPTFIVMVFGGILLTKTR